MIATVGYFSQLVKPYQLLEFFNIIVLCGEFTGLKAYNIYLSTPCVVVECSAISEDFHCMLGCFVTWRSTLTLK
jgi:hypothetical protein